MKDCKELEAKILNFRKKIVEITFHESFTGMNTWKTYLLKDYDKHFSIKTVKEGKVEND
jgi:hypothetical protein